MSLGKWNKLKLSFLGAIVIFGIGSIRPYQSILAAEAINYSTGFESSDGFTATTSYNNTTEKEQGPTGFKWGIIMGTASTTGPLVGAQSMQMRSYASPSTGFSTVGRVYPKWSFTNMTKVVFQAKADNASSTMSVEYSLNNSTWASMTLTGGPYSTTTSEITATVPEPYYGNQATIYFRINHTLTGTVSRCTIDSVAVYTIQSFGTLDHIGIDTMPSITSYIVGQTFSSTGLKVIGYDNENEEIANTQIYSSGFTTDYDAHVFTNDDIGNPVVVTVTYSGKTTTFNISVAAVPVAEHTLSLSIEDFNSTSYAANNGDHTKAAVDESGFVGYYTNQIYKNTSTPAMIQWQATNAYMYNTTDFVSIHSIIIDLGTGSSYLTIREGTSLIPSSGSIVTPSINGTIHTYSFSSNKGYFYISNGGTTTTISSLKVIPNQVRTDAINWSDSFLSSIGSICKTDNTTNITNLTNEWSSNASSYSSLTGDAKNYLYDFNDTEIASAKARYEYILEKYSLNNFLTNYAGTPVFSMGDNIISTYQDVKTDVNTNLILFITMVIPTLAYFGIRRFKRHY